MVRRHLTAVRDMCCEKSTDIGVEGVIESGGRFYVAMVTKPMY